MEHLFWNGPMQTTTAPASVATGTSRKTLIQIKPLVLVRVLEWGISFDGYAAAAPIKVELVEVDVAATVTAFVNNDITKVDGDALLYGDPTSEIYSVGTSASGYTSTGEGTITATRNLDAPQLIAPTNQFVKQFPLGDYPIVQRNKYARIIVTAPATVNAFCYLKLAA